MTQQQSASLSQAAQDLVAASGANDAAQQAARDAYAAFQEAHSNAVVAVPNDNKRRQDAANQASLDAEAVYTKAAEAGQSAQVKQSQAQQTLNQAILDSLQTGAVEMMPPARR